MTEASPSQYTQYTHGASSSHGQVGSTATNRSLDARFAEAQAGSSSSSSSSSSSIGRGKQAQYAQPEDAGVRKSATDEVGEFYFRRKSGRLDWQTLDSINPMQVVQDVDIETLQNVVANLTFADVHQEDLYMRQGQFVKLFQLAQLIVEYLIYSQEYLVAEKADLEEALAVSKERQQALQTQNNQLRDELALARSDLKTKKSAIKMYEYLLATAQSNTALAQQQGTMAAAHRCVLCTNKAFRSAHYLEKHIHKRHEQDAARMTELLAAGAPEMHRTMAEAPPPPQQQQQSQQQQQQQQRQMAPVMVQSAPEGGNGGEELRAALNQETTRLYNLRASFEEKLAAENEQALERERKMREEYHQNTLKMQEEIRALQRYIRNTMEEQKDSIVKESQRTMNDLRSSLNRDAVGHGAGVMYDEQGHVLAPSSPGQQQQQQRDGNTAQPVMYMSMSSPGRPFAEEEAREREELQKEKYALELEKLRQERANMIHEMEMERQQMRLDMERQRVEMERLAARKGRRAGRGRGRGGGSVPRTRPDSARSHTPSQGNLSARGSPSPVLDRYGNPMYQSDSDVYPMQAATPASGMSPFMVRHSAPVSVFANPEEAQAQQQAAATQSLGEKRQMAAQMQVRTTPQYRQPAEVVKTTSASGDAEEDEDEDAEDEDAVEVFNLSGSMTDADRSMDNFLESQAHLAERNARRNEQLQKQRAGPGAGVNATMETITPPESNRSNVTQPVDEEEEDDDAENGAVMVEPVDVEEEHEEDDDDDDVEGRYVNAMQRQDTEPKMAHARPQAGQRLEEMRAMDPVERAPGQVATMGQLYARSMQANDPPKAYNRQHKAAQIEVGRDIEELVGARDELRGRVDPHAMAMDKSTHALLMQDLREDRKSAPVEHNNLVFQFQRELDELYRTQQQGGGISVGARTPQKNQTRSRNSNNSNNGSPTSSPTSSPSRGSPKRGGPKTRASQLQQQNSKKRPPASPVRSVGGGGTPKRVGANVGSPVMRSPGGPSMGGMTNNNTGSNRGTPKSAGPVKRGGGGGGGNGGGPSMLMRSGSNLGNQQTPKSVTAGGFQAQQEQKQQAAARTGSDSMGAIVRAGDAGMQGRSKETSQEVARVQRSLAEEAEAELRASQRVGHKEEQARAAKANQDLSLVDQEMSRSGAATGVGGNTPVTTSRNVKAINEWDLDDDDDDLDDLDDFNPMPTATMRSERPSPSLEETTRRQPRHDEHAQAQGGTGAAAKTPTSAKTTSNSSVMTPDGRVHTFDELEDNDWDNFLDEEDILSDTNESQKQKQKQKQNNTSTSTSSVPRADADARSGLSSTFGGVGGVQRPGSSAGSGLRRSTNSAPVEALDNSWDDLDMETA